MPLKFVNPRTPESVGELTARQKEQLVVAGELYDGEHLSAEERLSNGGQETSFLGLVEVWDVMEGGVLVYEAWFTMVDSGTFFRAGTTEAIAEVIQFGLECNDEELLEELMLGIEAAAADHPDTLLAGLA